MKADTPTTVRVADAKPGSDLRIRVAWVLLFALIAAAGIAYSLVQPLGVSPDEAAHARYVKYIASHGTLPRWEFVGGGAAGYESQHPPLYYAIGALVYKLSSSLPENWRWQMLRWYTLLIGLLLVWVARGFLLDYFRGRSAPAMAATAAFGLTPLLLEYMTYINPDILSVFWCCVIVWMCLRIARGEARTRDRIVLSVALGMGLLTKLTVLGTVPVIVVAHIFEPHPGSGKPWEQRRLLLFATFLGAAALSGWWYFRNSLLYHSPFIHTQGRVGSGFDLVRLAGDGLHFLTLTVKNTYLTTWVERAWLPTDLLGQALYLLISVMLIAAFGAALFRRLRQSEPREVADPGQWLCIIFLGALIVLHQWQVWFVDYEFNAGGRYLLNGMVAIQALVIASLARMRRPVPWCAAWIGILVLVNVVSIHFMLTAVNDRVVPGWHLLKLTVPY